MINCNPETVSTDYDTVDRLYFEPLTFEDVSAIIAREQEAGADVVVRRPVRRPDAAEAGAAAAGRGRQDHRHVARFDRPRRGSRALREAAVGARHSAGAERHRDDAPKRRGEVAATIGFPLVVRPSYVLGGRAMAIVYDMAALDRYMTHGGRGLARAIRSSSTSSSRMPSSSTSMPSPMRPAPSSSAASWSTSRRPASTPATAPASCRRICVAERHVAQIRDYTRRIARALKVIGLMNAQFAIKDDTVYVLEVNPRASRTVPYLSKATGVPLAKVAARVMIGKTLAQLGLTEDLEVVGLLREDTGVSRSSGSRASTRFSVRR